MPDKDSITVVLPVHNQEQIIGDVLKSICQCASNNVERIVIILDGCTDNSQASIINVMPSLHKEIIIVETDDINEVKCSNLGLVFVYTEYALLIQDDMVIKEQDFDQRLLKPFKLYDNLLAVSGRDAVDAKIENGKLRYYNLAGRDGKAERDIFAIRDIVNRGPVLVNMDKMRALNFFDEDFAPISQDDSDLCLRAYRKGWIVGSYVIDYQSELQWSFSRRNASSAQMRDRVEERNLNMLIERHRDLIEAPKHSENIYLP